MPHADDLPQLADHLEDREVVAGQQVGLAAPAAGLGEQVPARDVLDIDEVEAAVEADPDLAVERVDEGAAGRRRRDVPGPERHARVDDHEVEDRRERQRDVVRQVLRAHVVEGVRPEIVGGVLVGRLPRGIEPDRRDRAGVDDPPHAERDRGRQHMSGARHVDVVDDLRVRDPGPVDRREVIDDVAAVHVPGERRPIEDVSLDPLDVWVGQFIEVASVLAGPDQRPDPPALGP